MNEKFLQLKLLKMDGEFFNSSEVKAFYFDSNTTGRIGILPDHTNFYAAAASGMIEIHLQDEKKTFFAEKGYVLVKDNICTMVADGFHDLTNMNCDILQHKIDLIQQNLAIEHSDALQKELLIYQNFLQRVN